jgi:signal transduction histidine kinase
MVAVVAGALLVASLGTFVVSQRVARRDARDELGRQATRLAATVEETQSAQVLRAVGAALKLEGAAVLRFGPLGRTGDAPPPGVTLADLDLARLRAGKNLTGVKGSLVYAAAPAERSRAMLVLVLTRKVGNARPAVGLWILVAGGLTLVVAAAVAANLGRRLTRPLREAEGATRRIAAGDLAARVPEVTTDGRELESLARSINSMAAELERSHGLERQFLLSISHDLRTPLTSIRGFAEALAEGSAPDRAQAASIILAEARRLERLVQDLLELAKLGSRRFSLELRSVDVVKIVADTVDGFVPAAADAGVDMALEPMPCGLFVTADRDRLAQVVANLVENALKFAGASITVGATAGADGTAQLWVQDDGPGIGKDDLARVFEPFVTTGRPASRAVGSGLGLAIVHELVTAMGGDVRAEPGSGGGARVVVTLRAYPGPQAGTLTG